MCEGVPLRGAAKMLTCRLVRRSGTGHGVSRTARGTAWVTCRRMVWCSALHCPFVPPHWRALVTVPTRILPVAPPPPSPSPSTYTHRGGTAPTGTPPIGRGQGPTRPPLAAGLAISASATTTATATRSALTIDREFCPQARAWISSTSPILPSFAFWSLLSLSSSSSHPLVVFQGVVSTVPVLPLRHAS